MFYNDVTFNFSFTNTVILFNQLSFREWCLFPTNSSVLHFSKHLINYTWVWWWSTRDLMVINRLTVSLKTFDWTRVCNDMTDFIFYGDITLSSSLPCLAMGNLWYLFISNLHVGRKAALVFCFLLFQLEESLPPSCLFLYIG